MEEFQSTECLYKIENNHVVITGCRSFDHTAWIPETIQGYPVTELAPYAFSAERRTEPEGMWTGSGERDTPPFLEGMRLRELYLPSAMKKIGSYAFYNCEVWERLHFYGSLRDFGAGAFTGCKKLKFIDVTMEQGIKSGLKDIISELRQELWVNYRLKEGEREYLAAKLIFPEFYEEAIENTPARIISCRTHGSGHFYRYSFDGKEIKFRDYDSQFFHMVHFEREELCVRMALNRLCYPYNLAEEHRKQYMAYLKEHNAAAAELALKDRDMEQLKWVLAHVSFTREDLEKAVEAANRCKNPEGLSFLMDYRHEHFKSRRKSFEL
ncbi:leucine-rich repeat protein [Lachnospiraceae bacterium 62-35]